MTLGQVLRTWGVTAFSRQTWGGRAVVRRSHGSYLLEVDGGVARGGDTFPYAFRFEDAVANDWAIVETVPR